MVDVKPIYLNKDYLFQTKIYCLDEIYLCSATIKFSKHTLYRSSCRPKVFCKKDVLKNLAKFTGKITVPEAFFNKAESLQPATLLKRRLWYKCFLLNFAKFLRTPFFTKHLRWLLLSLYTVVCLGATWHIAFQPQFLPNFLTFFHYQF